MENHSVQISRSAERYLKKVPIHLRRRLTEAIVSLKHEPRPVGCIKLSGFDDIFRLRVGQHQILYSVSDMEIVVLKIGHRRDVYR